MPPPRIVEGIPLSPFKAHPYKILKAEKDNSEKYDKRMVLTVQDDHPSDPADDGIFKLFLGKAYTEFFSDEVMEPINNNGVTFNLIYIKEPPDIVNRPSTFSKSRNNFLICVVNIKEQFF